MIFFPKGWALVEEVTPAILRNDLSMAAIVSVSTVRFSKWGERFYVHGVMPSQGK